MQILKKTTAASGYVSLRRASNMLGLPYGPLRRAVAEGHLLSIKIGKRQLVRIDQISKQLEQLSDKPTQENWVADTVQPDLFDLPATRGGRDE